jgi:sugar phosphate isomerase/epimerase
MTAPIRAADEMSGVSGSIRGLRFITPILRIHVVLAFLLFVAFKEIVAANPFFAMDTIARGQPEAVVPLLKELGYDGIGGQAGDDRMAAALEAQGLRFFNGYLTLSFDDAAPALDDRLRGALDRMRGHKTSLWLSLARVQKNGVPFAKSSEEADGIVLAKLREIADYANLRGVRIALYPHAGTWLERVEDAIRVADKLNRDDVGVTFNLCHWLKVEGTERDPLPVLKAALPRLMFVTINGADAGDTKNMGWDRLIQPLGCGTYDVAAFLGKLRAAQYTGPVGFQGYGIKQDAREVLTKTIAAWRAMSAGERDSATRQ